MKKRNDLNNIQKLPTQQWIEDWQLSVDFAKHQTLHENIVEVYLSTLGHISFDRTENAALSLDMELNDQIVHLYDGLIIYCEKMKARRSIEILMIEDGILYGRVNNRKNPKLVPTAFNSEAQVTSRIELYDHQIVLQNNENYFCCIYTHEDDPNLAQKFDTTFAIDFEAELNSRLSSRINHAGYSSQSRDQNELHFLCRELMTSSLRLGTGRIQGTWSNNYRKGNDIFDINTTLIQILAWSSTDIQIAESLLSGILRLQTSSGSIPSAIATNGTIIDLTAPRPIICMVAEDVLSKRKDSGLIDMLLPKLMRYLRWSLSHFDPTHRGIHSWRNQSEPLERDIYEPELATADLSALLLNEIESLERIAGWQNEQSTSQKKFSDEKARLISNLESLFWNPSAKDYSIAWAREKKYFLNGYCALLPMMCSSIKKGTKEVMIERLQQGELTGKTLHFSKWRDIDLSNDQLPILQKYLFIKALERIDTGDSIVYDYLRLSMSGFIEWYITKKKQIHKKSISMSSAAFVMLVNNQYDKYYQLSNPILNKTVQTLKRAKIDRVDLTIIASVIILLAGVRTFYALQNNPLPLTVLQTEMNVAYSELDFSTAMISADQIIEYYPEQANRARLYKANIALHHNNAAVALQMLTPLREKYPDSPGPMLLEAIALHQLEEFEDASRGYYEFCYLFDEIFPKIVEDAKLFYFLLQEKLELPNNWRVIYGHRICHEI